MIIINRKNLDAWKKINYDGLKNNYHYFKHHIEKNIKLMGVVKSNAYGHGILNVSRILQDLGVDYLAVANVGEGLKLRNSGINVPILILGSISLYDAQKVIKYNLTATITLLEQLYALDEQAKIQKSISRVHLKVDSGLSRLGFQTLEEVKKVLDVSKVLNHTIVEGLYTHFASSDDSDEQLLNEENKIFNMYVKELKEKYNIPLVHAAATGASLKNRETHYDMVRIGLALYGYTPFKTENCHDGNLIPLMSVHSKISYVKWIKAGTYIGYNRKFLTNNSTRIATIPIGYGHGINRRIFNGYFVSINGKKCPVVGNICMNSLMVDVTHLDDLDIEDEIDIVSQVTSSLKEMSHIADTPIDDLLTSLESLPEIIDI